VFDPHVRPSASDLEQVLEVSRDVLVELSSAELVLTGATGFYGLWLLESLAHATRRLGIRPRLAILTRRASAVRERFASALSVLDAELVEGDVRGVVRWPFQPSHVVHAATSTTSDPHAPPHASETASVILDGTRAVLEASRGAERLLYCSSGAVYGPQPPHIEAMPEDAAFAPDPLDVAQAYGTAKRTGEFLCAAATAEGQVGCVVARGYAFCAPGLALDAHFAVGNFLRDAALGKTIAMTSNGAPVRSYLYGTDLATWLWTMLVRGTPGRAYNLGSDEATDLASLARRIGALGGVDVSVGDRPSPRSYYVPHIDRARRELGLEVRVPLAVALERTLADARARLIR
jgi:nucleoside-diphosphate-sugar epimerase